MAWLGFGVLYAVLYWAAGVALHGAPVVLQWFRLPALLVPPLVGIVVIVRRRQSWSGCQWLFWATIALGLMMSAIGTVGWSVDELILGRQSSWLGWHAVFALFGAAAPLLALLAQPHRGRREDAAASTAVDIAGVAVVIGFLFSYFVTADGAILLSRQFVSLILLSELQQFAIASGLSVAAIVARRSRWGPTYRRLATGLWVQFAALTLSNAGIAQGDYRVMFVYDFVWIVPFAFYPWAASSAPSSAEDLCPDEIAFTPSRPWLIFAVLALVPLADSMLRRLLPSGASDAARDVSMAATLVSTLPILLARLAVERAQTRHADAKLRLLGAAVDQAEELIWIVGRDGRFAHTNGALRRAVCYDADAFDGLRLGDLVAAPSAPEAAALDEAVRDGRPWHGRIERRRRDGSTFPASATVVPLTDERGAVTAVLGIERDVSEELHLRAQLIHTERLSAAGQLVSGVAHELNNPLQSILGFTELLIEGERRRTVRRDLDRVRAEAERAGKIVANLLAFVRRTSSERAAADFNELVRGAVAIRAYELKTHNIEIEERYTSEPALVVVNREEIRQIVINLILNSEHAMQEREAGGRLSVRTSVSPAGVCVEVEDDGAGVPENLAGRIFEPFFTTKGVGEGTGLGLSISLGIAEAHGGSLVLLPSARGARFRLTLPICAGAQAAGEAALERVRATADPSRRALVVDDELAVRDLLRRLLGGRGFTVDVAEDGREACSLIEDRHYDLILCDIRMPRMGGLVFHERLRAERPHLLRGFAFITGDTASADVPRLIEPTRVPLLSKPFSTLELDRLLHQLDQTGTTAESS